MVAHLGEVGESREYRGEEVETIGRVELLERLRQGDVVVVDHGPLHRRRAGEPVR